MTTTEEILERQEKNQCQEGKRRKNFREACYHREMFWKCLKRMQPKKRPLDVTTNRPLVTGESGRIVVKDSCQMLRSKKVRKGKT